MIEIFGKQVCPYCDNVKGILENMDIEYTYIDIEEDSNAKEFIVGQGLRSVPQLYYNKKHYGGSEGIVDLIDDFEEGL